MKALHQFKEAHGLTADNRWISRTAGRKDLVTLFKRLGYRSGAEIGVWEGQFSEQLCVGNPGVRLLCVDPWRSYAEYGDPKNNQRRLDDAHRTAVARLKPYRCDVRQMTSLDAAKSVADGSLDFVFLDGNHGKQFVLDDLAAWMPKVRSSGIVSGHDYEVKKKHAHLEVREAVDEFAPAHGIAPVYVLANDNVPSFFWVQP